MKSWFTRMIAAGSGLLFFVSAAFGSNLPDVKLSDWRIGPTLIGETHSSSDLAGKVVVIENWGLNCPPCIAALPHLAKFEKSNRKKGLVVIGAESQGHTAEQIKPLIEKSGVEYTITAGASGPVQIIGIPRAFVFDRQGALVYDGSPLDSGFESSVKKALSKKAPAAPAITPPSAPLVASRSWKNTEGKEIIAAVKSATETSVIFLMPDGKSVSFPMEKLDDPSQAEIRKALAKSVVR